MDDNRFSKLRRRSFLKVEGVWSEVLPTVSIETFGVERLVYFKSGGIVTSFEMKKIMTM